MAHGRAVRGIGAVAAITIALLPVGMPDASAHVHPSPVNLTGPAVVYIESGYHVEIALIEHSVTATHINVIQRSYDPVLLRGSGFAVDPSAVIVTSSNVVRPDSQAAMNYAVNKIFHARYRSLKLPANNLDQQGVGRVPDNYSPENRLRACYRNQTNASAGGCVIKLTRVVTVYPYVTNQKKYGALAATVLTPNKATPDIALLRVSANSLPTVNLADAGQSTDHLYILGFDAMPGKAHPPLDYKAHLDKADHTNFQAPVGDNKDFALVTPTVLSRGLQGGAVAAELGQVIGLIAPPINAQGQITAGRPRLIGSKAIRAALSSQQPPLQPLRGPADGPYESGIHPFTNGDNGGYTASIPFFKKTLAVYPGHYLAAQDLAIAQKAVGPSSSGSGQSGSPAQGAKGSSSKSPSTGVAWWVWLLAVLVLLLIALAAALLMRRRRRDPRKAAAGMPSPRTATTHGRPSGSAGSPERSRPAHGDSLVTAASVPSRRASSTGPRGDWSPRADESNVSRGVARGTGQAAAIGMFCTSCGERRAANHRYCGLCGEPVA